MKFMINGKNVPLDVVVEIQRRIHENMIKEPILFKKINLPVSQGSVSAIVSLIFKQKKDS